MGPPAAGSLVATVIEFEEIEQAPIAGYCCRARSRCRHPEQDWRKFSRLRFAQRATEFPVRSTNFTKEECSL